MISYKIKINGDIRENAFRSAAMHAAYRFRISGFIRYDDENSLTIEAQGELNDLHQFVQFCRDWFTDEVIQDFIISEKEPENYPDFTIRRNESEEEKYSKNQPWFQKIKDILRP